MVYDLYLGGIKAVSTTLAINYSSDSYQMNMDGRISGWLKIFTPWEGIMETKGLLLSDGQGKPQFHQSVSIWPDNTQIKKFSWNSEGILDDLYLSEEGRTSGMEDLDRDMANDTVDIMTASFSIMQAVTKEGRCTMKMNVFDGKRSFLLEGIDRGKENLLPSRYNRYVGEAVKCEIHIVPLKGNWHEKLRGWMSIQGQGREAEAQPTVWLAPLKEGVLAVPVKMRVKTKYGVFLMHLKDFH